MGLGHTLTEIIQRHLHGAGDIRHASRFFSILSESIRQSPLVQYYQLKWQGWDNPTN